MTTSGSSAASGSSRATRAIASRVSAAATSRSVALVNSTVTRLRPNEEEEDTELTPGTRPAARSTTAVISRSIVSGAAPA